MVHLSVFKILFSHNSLYFGLNLWKDIRKGWKSSFLELVSVLEMVDTQVFWWDNWVGDSKLKDVFPSLFRIAAHKFAIVADLWGRQGGGGGCWEVDFRRSFQDWKLEEATRFLEHISVQKVEEGEDSLVWKNDGRGKFSVKSYY